jgi:hypothetical protein
MEMKINLNDECIDDIVEAGLKLDYESSDCFEDSESIKRAIVTLMSLYMTYDDYFTGEKNSKQVDEYTSTYDEYRKLKNIKGE